MSILISQSSPLAERHNRTLPQPGTNCQSASSQANNGMGNHLGLLSCQLTNSLVD